MQQYQHDRLWAWFVVYVVGVVVLFLTLPRLFANVYPWDYWWVFVLFTPTVAVLGLRNGGLTGRYSWWAIGIFYLASVAFGLLIAWFSYYLLAYAVT